MAQPTAMRSLTVSSGEGAPSPRTSGSPDGAGRRDLRRTSSIAALVAPRYSQVPMWARPSKSPMLRHAAISASCRASLASCSLQVMRRQIVYIRRWWRWTSSSKAERSPYALRIARASSGCA